ncbi:MAG TPA: hypothetical protein VMW36_02090 [Patescibacteria group bacterium]|nr:hypothetical protein [Patescibacteria group bacterium]
MKVLKQGKKPEEREAKFDCTNCKSELRAKQGEGEYISDRDGHCIKFNCPVCDCTIHVDVILFN